MMSDDFLPYPSKVHIRPHIRLIICMLQKHEIGHKPFALSNYISKTELVRYRVTTGSLDIYVPENIEELPRLIVEMMQELNEQDEFY